MQPRLARPASAGSSVAPIGEAPAPRRRTLAHLALAAAVLLGVVVRAAHVLAARFPLNDGALFYAMTRDIQRAGYHLPAFTSYNAAEIPFGYSPLGFYAAALVADVTPLPLIDVFRWLPLTVTALTVAAFALLADALLKSRWTLVAAVVAFSLTPRSFLWLIMGGGLTRSFGFLFAILALHQVYRLYTRQEGRYAAGAAVFAALTVYSHLGTAPFLAFSSGLFFLAYGRHRRGVLYSLAVAVGTIVLTAPWWRDVLATHGLTPFLAAFGTGGTIFSAELWERALGALSSFGLGTSEPILSLIGMLAVIGALASLQPGRRFLPAWWIVTVLLDQRAGSTYATLPLAMLAGVGLIEVVLPLLTGRRARGASDIHLAPRPRWLPAAVLSLFFAFATYSAAMRRSDVSGELGDLRGLTPDEIRAMRWVAGATPTPSRFLVLAQTSWEIDRTGEWFPVLAERVSVATVQGTEWLPNHAFKRKEQQYNALQGCGGWVSVCLDDWSRSTGVRFTHVYIPKTPERQCCRMLRYSLERDPRYAVVYDGPGAQVFAHRAAVASLSGAVPRAAGGSRSAGRSVQLN